MGSSRAVSGAPTADPTYRELISLSAPLAFSAFVMNLEGPVVASGLSRLPEPALALAAFGVAFNLALLVESPIISMLEGSIALVRDRQSFFRFGLFMAAAGLGLALLGFGLYFTPAVDRVMLDVLGVPPEIAREAAAAVRFLVLWPPLIGLRRFLQGLMVRFGKTRPIAYAVVVRLAVLGIVVFWGPSVFHLPGAMLGTLAEALSVAAEALLIAWWSRPAVGRVLHELPSRGISPLTAGAILKFYTPLIWMQVLLNAVPSVITGGIGRATLPELSLAAWPVVNSTVNLVGNPLSMLQHTVIAVGTTRAHRVSRFTVGAGLVGSAALTLLAFTPLLDVYLGGRLGLTPRIVDLARTPVRILVVLPVLVALRALLRGRLVAVRQTSLVGLAVTIYLLAIAVLLPVVAARTGFPGVVAAGIALVGATAAEVGFLALGLTRWGVRRLQKGQVPAPTHCANMVGKPES